MLRKAEEAEVDPAALHGGSAHLHVMQGKVHAVS
jgi:hypothetical protein